MRAIFRGTRGSIPSLGPASQQIGGNTTCLEIETGGGKRTVIDAGTGIRALGSKLNASEPITLLLTHSHWDHLNGFDFFKPAYDHRYEISVYGKPIALDVLRKDIIGRYHGCYLDEFRASFSFNEEFPRPFVTDDVMIETIDLKYPGSGFGFSFSEMDGDCLMLLGMARQ